MLNKSTLTLFVTVALAGFTAAFPHRRNIAPFTTIPLGKRNTLTRDDGTFDTVKAVHSASRTKSKHEQNLRNFQRNVPGVALSEEVRSIFIIRTLDGLSSERSHLCRPCFTSKDWFRTADGPGG